MYRTCSEELRKNSISIELHREQGINLAIHWLNPLLCKR